MMYGQLQYLFCPLARLLVFRVYIWTAPRDPCPENSSFRDWISWLLQWMDSWLTSTLRTSEDADTFVLFMSPLCIRGTFLFISCRFSVSARLVLLDVRFPNLRASTLLSARTIRDGSASSLSNERTGTLST